MELNELKEHLRLHKLWIENNSEGKRANLSGADLSCANLSGADLSGANLYGANLSGANLYGAYLYRANLSDANLYGAYLYRADLSGANLSGADLSGANLSGADLSGANLRQTLLENRVILTFLYNKHTAYYFGDGFIQIGCHKKTIVQWIKEYEEIGKLNSYTSKEIEKYGKFIKGCAKIQKELDL